jgi:hypothetical protein
MKIPNGSNKYFPKFCKWAYKKYNDSFFTRFFIRLLVALPPLLVTTLYTNKSLKLYLSENFTEFYTFISTLGNDFYVLFIFLFAFIWTPLCFALGIEITKRAQSNGLNVDGLLALLTSLDAVVAKKNKRFSDHVRKSDQLTKETAFENITEPFSQIEEIIREICSFFNATRTNNKKSLIRVSMAVFENNKIVNIPIYFPYDEPIRSSLPRLNQKNSAFQTAYKNKRMLLISDVQKELKKQPDKRKFAETENEVDNIGSIICYPIVTIDQTVPFVVSIHCDDPGYFKDEYRDIYEHSLMRFSLRINIEYNLLLLKEKLCGKT